MKKVCLFSLLCLQASQVLADSSKPRTSFKALESLKCEMSFKDSLGIDYSSVGLLLRKSSDAVVADLNIDLINLFPNRELWQGQRAQRRSLVEAFATIRREIKTLSSDDQVQFADLESHLGDDLAWQATTDHITATVAHEKYAHLTGYLWNSEVYPVLSSETLKEVRAAEFTLDKITADWRNRYLATLQKEAMTKISIDLARLQSLLSGRREDVRQALSIASGRIGKP